MFLGFSGLKEIIIKELLNGGDLSAKEIYSRIKKVYSKDISYQGVHKVIKELLDESVLLKKDRFYFLSEEWINLVKTQSNLAYQKTALANNTFNNFEEFEFFGIIELADFLINNFFNYPNPKNKPSVNLWFFPYSVIGVNRELTSKLVNSYSKTPTFCFVNELNNLDVSFSKALKKMGVKKVVQRNNSATDLLDLAVIGDFVAYIWYDSDFRNLWKRQNRSPKKLEEFDLINHLKNMQKIKARIKVFIINDNFVADNIRKEYLSNYFVKK